MGRKFKRGERARILFFLISAMVSLLLVGFIIAIAVPTTSTTSSEVVNAKPTRRAISPRDAECNAATMQGTIDAFAEAEIPAIFHCRNDVELLNGLVIKGDVTIVGADPELRDFRVFMDGAQYAERLFYVQQGAALTLVSVEVTRSRRYGIYATPGSMINLEDVVFTQINEGSSDGAAIYNEGGAVVMSSSFISMGWGQVAIQNNGQLWLEDSVIWSSVGCVDNGADATAQGVEITCVDA